MSFKVKFLKDTAGRKANHLEEFGPADETLVREWEAAGCVQVISAPKTPERQEPWERAREAAAGKSADRPPQDKAIKGAAIRKRSGLG